jgi:hypothetical protein
MQGYLGMRSGWYAARLYGVGLSVVQGACDPQDGEPRVALGYITAVTEEHPETFSFESAGGNLAPTSSSGISTMQAWCADEEQTNCYTETLVCPTPDTPPEDCVVERSGDPSIKEPMWRFFAGFSQNYVVAYLKDPAPAGSGTAAVLGEPDGFDRGYQLLKVREYDEAIQQRSHDCVARSEARALEHYNHAHDTTFATDQIDVARCGLGPACIPDDPSCEEIVKPAVCELASDEQDELIEELRVGALRAQLDLGCLVSQFEPVGNAARISISIARDAAPSFGPNQAAVF